MTIILSVVSRRCAIQVVDRALSTETRRFDSQANKTLVYRARGGIACLSYTGLGFIDNECTDDWIAHTIIGKCLRREFPNASFVGGSYLAQWLSLGRVIRRIGEGFDEVRPSLRQSLKGQRLEIVATGFVWKGTHFRPLHLGYTWEHPESRGIFWSGRRWLGPREFETAIAPRQNARLVDVPALQVSLRGLGEPQAIRDRLISALRDAAEQSAVVGSDAIAITIDAPVLETPSVHIAFHPQNAPSVLPVGVDVEPANAGSFVPWLISPTTISTPSLHAGPGTLTYELAGYSANIVGIPVMTNGAAMRVRSQERKRWRP